MTMAHSHIDHRAHTLPFRDAPSNYGDHRFEQDRMPYRLPPPNSSIPLGFKTEDRRLPSVRQLLCHEDPSQHSTSYYGRSPRSSPPTTHRSLDSQWHHTSPRELGNASVCPVVSPNAAPRHSLQSTRLPSLSQVGIEPPRSHAALEQGSRGRQYHQHEFTTSPGGSSHGSPEMHHSASARLERGARGPTLPTQVVEEKYLPGKGLCYIFADQSTCPKSIDGEPVNPNWGLTKAGKARKRLAQACIPCREKKIKCQPSKPRCDQCQKSGRDCRFESAPRGNRARSSSYDSHPTRPGSRQMMRSTPSSPREVDMVMHSLPPSSGSPPFQTAPTSHPFAPEAHTQPHSDDRAKNLLHAHKRRRRGGPFDPVEGSLASSKYTGDFTKTRQMSFFHSDYIEAGYRSKF
ncbi:hypothetical protein BGW36DRAFT_356222 [Talaromyces proteolyticus]|uniref:Zn(2)-C6 fungal-type domain-containing protein n=1 Tax=Talaromyces proteolyticus TaxID=1131652 RepID=A0AAD4Q3R7_9EURO|nr:uncharacterized protein BGW36DRAFT_356222 [Talaromyces proteolyticus]KAH8702083.1 hypothetical protein BGW36DRAFT_356222 [Talaromyces proteolyticus]